MESLPSCQALEVACTLFHQLDSAAASVELPISRCSLWSKFKAHETQFSTAVKQYMIANKENRGQRLEAALCSLTYTLRRCRDAVYRSILSPTRMERSLPRLERFITSGNQDMKDSLDEMAKVLGLDDWLEPHCDRQTNNGDRPFCQDVESQTYTPKVFTNATADFLSCQALSGQFQDDVLPDKGFEADSSAKSIQIPCSNQMQEASAASCSKQKLPLQCRFASGRPLHDGDTPRVASVGSADHAKHAQQPPHSTTAVCGQLSTTAGTGHHATAAIDSSHVSTSSDSGHISTSSDSGHISTSDSCHISTADPQSETVLRHTCHTFTHVDTRTHEVLDNHELAPSRSADVSTMTDSTMLQCDSPSCMDDSCNSQQGANHEANLGPANISADIPASPDSFSELTTHLGLHLPERERDHDASVAASDSLTATPMHESDILGSEVSSLLGRETPTSPPFDPELCSYLVSHHRQAHKNEREGGVASHEAAKQSSPAHEGEGLHEGLWNQPPLACGDNNRTTSDSTSCRVDEQVLRTLAKLRLSRSSRKRRRALRTLLSQCQTQLPALVEAGAGLILAELANWIDTTSLVTKLTPFPPLMRQFASMLHHLRLRDATTIAPGICALSGLCSLDLSLSTQLVSVPHEIGQLTSLRLLDLSGCRHLTSIAPSIGCLTLLQTLDLSGCVQLSELPPTIGNLSNLLGMTLIGCRQLTHLPNELEHLTRCETLSFHACVNLTQLPETMGGLSALQMLDLSACSALASLPLGIGQLSHLQILLLRGCSQLALLPPTLGALVMLESLDLGDCTSLTHLPAEVGNLSSLHTLSLSGCSQLSTLPPEIGSLSSLEVLDLRACSHLSHLPPTIGQLQHLPALNLSGCGMLTGLPAELCNLSNMHTLNLSECSALSSLPPQIGDLRSLEALDFTLCTGLDKIPEEICHLSKLQTLYLSQCTQLLSLPSHLGSLSSLHTLNLYRCSQLKQLPSSFGMLAKLQNLSMNECRQLTSLPEGFSKLSSLKVLDMCLCVSLSSLPPVMPPDLEDLELRGCTRLTSLSPQLGQMLQLQWLHLSATALPAEVGKLQNLHGLSMHSTIPCLPPEIGLLSNLHALGLQGCSALTTLPAEIGQLSALEFLNLSDCSQLMELPPEIGQLHSLDWLDLRRCSALRSLPPELGNLCRLEWLQLSACSSLTHLPPQIGQLTSLGLLDVSGCTQLLHLPPQLGKLGSLQTLFVDSCDQLALVPLMGEQLCSLKLLHIVNQGLDVRFPLLTGIAHD